MKRLLIGLGTFQRPKMLENALNYLRYIQLPAGLEVELLLVDNDTAGSAQSVFDQASGKLPFKSFYQIEPNRGIVFFRNRILKYACNNQFDLLAFFDDDEQVPANWLVEHMGCLEVQNADVSVGPVNRILPGKTVDFIKNGGFFKSPDLPSGTVRMSANTNNVVMRMDWFRERDLWFNDRLNLVGSSDTHFFTRATQLGAKIVWCATAVVSEEIPESRANAAWLKQRAYRHAMARFARSKIENGHILTVFREIPFLFRMLITALFRSVFFFRGPAYRLKTSRFLNKGIGMFHAMVGISYEEYRHIHGH